MIAFLYLLREIAEDPPGSPSGLTFEDRLRHVSPRAADTWAALVAAYVALPEEYGGLNVGGEATRRLLPPAQRLR
jgi:hypothetical protein